MNKIQITLNILLGWLKATHQSQQMIEKDFAVHEAICAQRYEAIEKSFVDGDRRMTRIEYLLYIVIGAVLLGPGFAGELIKKVLGL
jgi:hypothetical protein